MCDDIMQEVAGCALTGEPGTLRGFCRRGVKGEHYPALIPEADSCVDGILYLDVPQAAWERLDRFEGEMYFRRRVPIEPGGGKTVAAQTYIVKPGFMDLLKATEWDFSEFLRSGKARFQKRYKGYGAL
jgi:gamma-glutamylcyclotransferase (GGCT)/AIG2-like uncharacterized protein YtfP